MWRSKDEYSALILIFMGMVCIIIVRIIVHWVFGAFDYETSKMAAIKTPECEIEIVEVEDYWIKNGIISVESTDGKTYIVPVEDVAIE